MISTSRTDDQPAVSTQRLEKGDDYLAASGFMRLLGYRIVCWKPDYAELELELGPQHLNRWGSVHGGVLSTLIDVSCALAGLYCSVSGPMRNVTTLSLNTQFTGQASAGALRASGRLRKRGRTIYYSSAEIVDSDGQLIAYGDAVNRYRPGAESPVRPSPPLV